MPIPTIGEITQQHLDDVADLAEAKLIKHLYEKWGGATLSGTYEFPAITDVIPRGLADVYDRMYNAIYEADQDGGALNTFSYTTSVFDGYESKDRVWEVMTSWMESSYPRLICPSMGPHLWTHTDMVAGGAKLTEPDGVGTSAHKMVPAFKDATFIYSQLDHKPFAKSFKIRSGLVAGTLKVPYHQNGDGRYCTNVGTPGTGTGPAKVSFDYNIPDFNYYGQIWFEFTKAGAGSTSPSDYGMSFTGIGSGFGGVAETVNDVCRIYLDDKPVTIIIPGGGGPASGTAEFFAYVNDTGWTFTGFGMTGLFQFASMPSLNSEDGVVTDFQVIHPRNESMRLESHIRDSADLAPGDLLNVHDFIMELKANATPTIQYLNSQWEDDLPTWIFEYPGGANDAAIPGELVTQINDNIINDSVNIGALAAWSAVDLRDITQFLVDLDLPPGPLLARANRLSLEDAFPSYIRALPPPVVTPEQEIVQLSLPDIDVDTDGWFFGDGVCLPGHFCMLNAWDDTAGDPVDAEGEVAGMYIAKAWPQVIQPAFLDFWLPQYFKPIPESTIIYESSLRATNSVLGPGSPTSSFYLSPVQRDQMCSYPIQRAAAHGSFTEKLARQTWVAPYWEGDQHHQWGGLRQYHDQPILPIPFSDPEFSYFGSMIMPNNDSGNTQLSKLVMEHCWLNRNVELYLSLTDYPDPDNAATYDFKETTKGFFTFPQDFIDYGLIPSAFYGQEVFITMYNRQPTAQPYGSCTSVFYSLTGEEPPYPEPNFFRRHSLYNDKKYDMALPDGGDGLGVGRTNYVFTHSSAGGTDKCYPVPDRGYVVHGLSFKRKPVPNASGIRVEATDLSDAITIKVGIMAGTGVVAGASVGVFPGRFIEFMEFDIAIGDVSSTFPVFFPVLEGHPLAYIVTSPSGAEVLATAYVTFQPMANVGFVHGTRQVSGAGGSIPPPFRTGAWCGKPYLLKHIFWAENLNNDDPDFLPRVVDLPKGAEVGGDMFNLLTMLP